MHWRLVLKIVASLSFFMGAAMLAPLAVGLLYGDASVQPLAEAMGITLGVGLVVGLAYSNMDINDVISGDAEIAFLVILMSLTYLAGVFIGTRKYR